MAARAMWKGGVAIGMVTFPIGVYKATDTNGGIKLNQLHGACGKRINEKKVCPEHGELTIADIVKGYEYGPGEYVQLTEAEIDSIRIDSDRALQISQFVPAGSVPFGKADYYLGTDKLGGPAYTLMRDQMAKLGVVAVTKVSFRGREQLATIRASGNVLILTTHYWPDEVRDADGLVPEVPERPQAEQTMARNLIKGMTSEFEPETQVDAYGQALLSLIEDKIAGRPVTPPAEVVQAPPPMDLMAVLAASVEAQKVEKKPARRGKA